MKTSSEITKLAPALLKAQRAMLAAAKSATNPHFKSKYADLATIIDATKGPLNEQEIICLQGVTSDSTGVMVETTLMHSSGEWIADTLFMPVPQQTPQAYGSAITYGRRYGLQALVCLPAEDDDGNKASEAPTRPNTAKQVAVDALQTMAPEEQQFLRDIAMEIIAEHDSGKDVRGFIEAKKLDNEERLAIWSLLPSQVRAALKAKQRSQELGSQP